MRKCEFCGANLDANEACNCRIRVVVKVKGAPAEAKVIENSIDAIKRLVGEAAASVELHDNLVLICTGRCEENGTHDLVLNTAVIAAADGDDFRGLTVAEGKEMCLWLDSEGEEGC